MKKVTFVLLVISILFLCFIFAYILFYFIPTKFTTTVLCSLRFGEITQYENPENIDSFNPPEPKCPENKVFLGNIVDGSSLAICCR